MSFASPAVLVALALVPVLVVVYLGHHRRGLRAAAAFAAPAMGASVAPKRPGFRRHLPMAVVLVAIAGLIVAAARPQTTKAVPAEQATIVLASDISGSMLATDVAPTRLAAAKSAALTFVGKVPRRVNIGVVAFNQVPRVLETPTRDRAAVSDAIGAMTVSGGTATGTAIQTAVRLVTSARQDSDPDKPPPAAIVLLSDGASTRGIDPAAAAQAAARLKIPIYTVSLGTAAGTITVTRANGTTEVKPVPPDTASLQRIAEVSGGKAFTAENAGDLSQAYENLGSQLGRKTEKRELTAGFAGGALALLLLGSVMSLRWFGRLV